MEFRPRVRQIQMPSQRRTAERPSSAVRRRLTLETPSFYSQTSVTSPGQDYYVPESPTAQHWGPGQVLPTYFNSESAQQSCPDAEVKSLIQGLQSSVETNFDNIKKKLGDLEERVAKVEEKQLQIQNSPISSGYNSSSSQSDSRKRRSPPDLQNQLRHIHAALDEENQLRLSERVDSDHNRKVVQSIIMEIGTDKFTERQIKDGIRFYCKTLKEASKGRPSPVKKKVRIRSHQQRLYERRSKVVKQRELKHWKAVAADMMSEEEESGDWRSQKLNAFIDKIESQLAKNTGKIIARRREYGEECIRPVPDDIPRWMKESDDGADNDPVDQALSDDSGSEELIE